MTAWIASLATGLAVVSALLLLWLVVQRAWARSFPGVSTDGDALAGRPGCGGCRHVETCAPDGSAGTSERRRADE